MKELLAATGWTCRLAFCRDRWPRAFRASQNMSRFPSHGHKMEIRVIRENVLDCEVHKQAKESLPKVTFLCEGRLPPGGDLVDRG